TYASRLEREGLIAVGDLDRFKHAAEALVEEQARAVIDAPWPEPVQAGVGVFANEPPRRHVEVLDPEVRLPPPSLDVARDGPELAEGPRFALRRDEAGQSDGGPVDPPESLAL